AARLDCRLEGDGAIEIHRVAGLSEAGPGDLTFLANPKYQQAALQTKASAIILADDAPAAPCAMLRSAHPYRAFARALALFGEDERPAPGVHPTAFVDPAASLGRDVSVGPFAVVGAGAVLGDRVVLGPHAVVGPGARIGEDSVIHARVSIRERSIIGARVVIQDGAVIGSDGFGFVTDEQGVHHKIPQQRSVVIEDDVEIGANTTIDRPAVGETRIRRGVKIDNLVQIAHNVRVGAHTAMAARTGIAGSTTIGKRCMIGGGVGIIGHLSICDDVILQVRSLVAQSIDKPGMYGGTLPADDAARWRRNAARFRQLDELAKRVRALERKK
ncbi:MAG TPA: UDP-3-O-(3-hydroxymyristoyl)glucosamine N-acyltransferase, partial [Gammaproteobacteria bacterium]